MWLLNVDRCTLIKREGEGGSERACEIQAREGGTEWVDEKTDSIGVLFVVESINHLLIVVDELRLMCACHV